MPFTMFVSPSTPTNLSPLTHVHSFRLLVLLSDTSIDSSHGFYQFRVLYGTR